MEKEKNFMKKKNNFMQYISINLAIQKALEEKLEPKVFIHTQENTRYK